jgi:hypothetical protein
MKTSTKPRRNKLLQSKLLRRGSILVLSAAGVGQDGEGNLHHPESCRSGVVSAGSESVA